MERVSIETITPEVARQYLACNTRNRPVMRTHVSALIEEMRSGRFVMNGDTIRFNGNVLLDGQHRLLACVESGVPFRSVVVRDLPDSCFATINNLARGRSGVDVLSIAGETYATIIAPAARYVYMYDMLGSQVRGKHQKARMGGLLLQRFLDQNPGLRLSAAAVKEHKIKSKQRYVMAAMHYIFSRTSQPLADQFLDVMAFGSDDLSRPFNLLRERMINDALNSRRSSGIAYMALAIKAFNAELGGKRPGVLKWTDREAFPVVTSS